MRFFLLFSCLFVSFVANSDQIKVGTIGDPPYVIWKENQVTGFSIGLWNIIAERLQLKTEFKNFDSLEQALQALKDHSVDLLVGPIAVTPELAKNFAYTQPYHRVQLGAATLQKSHTYWQHVKNIIGKNFFFYAIILVLFFLLTAFLIWTFERKANNEQFHANPKDAISEGIWFTLCTLTTNGYMKFPAYWKGRIVASLWMVFGCLLYASIIASLTSFFTHTENTQENFIGQSLNGKKVVVADQAIADLVNEDFNTINYLANTMDNAFSQLENDTVYAIVYDKALLRYYIKDHHETQAILLSTLLAGEHYAFLFASFDNKYFNKVNEEIIRTASDNSTNKIKARWIK